MLSTIFHNSWQSGHVNLIISPDIADGMNEMLKQLPPLYMASSLSYVHSVVLDVFPKYGRV